MKQIQPSKGVLKVVFLTLFLDLVGFSIIFPIFPALAEFYLQINPENFFLRFILDGIVALTALAGAPETVSPIVLFGGVLGALYSLLQFGFAPFWGTVSDRIGRRPVLLLSVSGLALSYLLWFFAESFTVLIVARVIGGVMSGNISTATAVIADVTDEKSRSKGMALVGIAFALGFICGPAIGGVLALVDLTQVWPYLTEFGVNPFSVPALFALILSVINIIYLWRVFPETLPPERRGQHPSLRTSNPFKLLRPLPFPNVNTTNAAYFLYITAFAGMEFTLTFLAVERLGYTPLQNGYMFVFAGFVLAAVQGGIVRRYASVVGEVRMSIFGLVLLVPSMLCIGHAHSTVVIYLGLFLMSVGSALVVPCVTALVSVYSPVEEQGRSLGIFRSLGALARVVGPLVACFLYWKWGAHVPYEFGAVFLILPILLLRRLPRC